MESAAEWEIAAGIVLTVRGQKMFRFDHAIRLSRNGFEVEVGKCHFSGGALRLKKCHIEGPPNMTSVVNWQVHASSRLCMAMQNSCHVGCRENLIEDTLRVRLVFRVMVQ